MDGTLWDSAANVARSWTDVVQAQYEPALRRQILQPRHAAGINNVVQRARKRPYQVVKMLAHARAYPSMPAACASATAASITCASVISEVSSSLASAARHSGDAARWLSL